MRAQWLAMCLCALNVVVIAITFPPQPAPGTPLAVMNIDLDYFKIVCPSGANATLRLVNSSGIYDIGKTPNGKRSLTSCLFNGAVLRTHNTSADIDSSYIEVWVSSAHLWGNSTLRQMFSHAGRLRQIYHTVAYEPGYPISPCGCADVLDCARPPFQCGTCPATASWVYVPPPFATPTQPNSGCLKRMDARPYLYLEAMSSTKLYAPQALNDGVYQMDVSKMFAATGIFKITLAYGLKAKYLTAVFRRSADANRGFKLTEYSGRASSRKTAMSGPISTGVSTGAPRGANIANFRGRSVLFETKDGRYPVRLAEIILIATSELSDAQWGRCRRRARPGCAVCNPGFYPPTCAYGCNLGRWGMNCQNVCEHQCALCSYETGVCRTNHDGDDACFPGYVNATDGCKEERTTRRSALPCHLLNPEDVEPLPQMPNKTSYYQCMEETRRRTMTTAGTPRTASVVTTTDPAPVPLPTTKTTDPPLETMPTLIRPLTTKDPPLETTQLVTGPSKIREPPRETTPDPSPLSTTHRATSAESTTSSEQKPMFVHATSPRRHRGPAPNPRSESPTERDITTTIIIYSLIGLIGLCFLIFIMVCSWLTCERKIK